MVGGLRATEATIRQARQGEIAMLRQIDQIQQGINASVDQQIETLYTGGLDTQGQIAYFRDHIQEIMQSLRAGEGMNSPEQVQALMADLQRYISAYQGVLGEDLYADANGNNRADWLMDILEEGRGLSNDALEGFRDQVREINEALIAELQILFTALTALTGAIQDEPPTFDVDLGLDINIHADDGFWAEVDARIERQLWREGANTLN